MRLQNTSRYPAEEVRRLVEFACKGVNMTCVEVHVKNCSHAYRGRAYDGVPTCSPAARKVTVDRLVTIGIGQGKSFPANNLVTVHRKKVYDGPKAGMPEYDLALDKVTIYCQTDRVVIVKGERQPYGGKRAPMMEVTDWREALVMVAAHEARHIYQFKNRKPRSEGDAEKFAAKRLDEYRALKISAEG